MKPRRPFGKKIGVNSGWRRSRGFTLIEIMMVVAIIGLTLTMGMPAFLRTMQREGMRKAEYDLVEACTAARRAAIMNNEITYLVLHPTDGTFEVPGAFEQKKFPEGISIAILGVNFIQFENSDYARVAFLPNGTSDEFTIVLKAPNGSDVMISLDTITALPQVKMLN
jgi:general secretion pathway protein H